MTPALPLQSSPGHPGEKQAEPETRRERPVQVSLSDYTIATFHQVTCCVFMFLSGLPLAYRGGYQKAALNGPLTLQGLLVGGSLEFTPF